MSFEEKTAVKSHFKRHNLHGSEEWIDACIDFCKAENPGINKLRLVESVRMQWLDSNLDTDGVQAGPQIPTSLDEAMDVPAITLQVTSAVDITKPAYAQLQTVLKVDNQNTEVNAERTQSKTWDPPPPQRMLKMIMSDGFSTVRCLEMKPCPEIPDPVPCGLKITLIGPVEVRRGMLLLNSKCIKVLGGFVEELERDHDLKSRLEKRLKGPETAFLPSKKYVKPSGDDLLTFRVVPETRKVSSAKRENPFSDEDDDLFMDIPDDFSKDDDIFKDVEVGAESQPAEKKPRIEDLPSYRPFRYLKSLSEAKDGEVIVVKCCIVSLIGKLSMKEETRGKSWHLITLVTDGSHCCNIALSPTLLDEWIGTDPDSYLNLSSKDKAEAKKTIKKVSERLMKLNNLVKVLKKSPKSEIFEVISLNRGHAQQLKIRCQKYEI